MIATAASPAPSGDVAILTDTDTLRAALRDTLAVLIPMLAPWARRSGRTQWAALSDVIATALWSAGEALGDAPRGREEAALLLDGTPPFTGTANFVELAHHGAARTWRVRNTCCLAWTTTAIA